MDMASMVLKFFVLLLTFCSLSAQTLHWDANDEVDLAGYKVYGGGHSGDRQFFADVGQATEFVFDRNVTAYFVVTAYDTAGNESLFSAEVAWIIGDSAQIVRWPRVAPLAFIVDMEGLDVEGEPIQAQLKLEANGRDVVYVNRDDTIFVDVSGYITETEFRFRACAVNAAEPGKSGPWLELPETLVFYSGGSGIPRPLRVFRLVPR